MNPEGYLELANGTLNVLQTVALAYIAARWREYPPPPRE
jgi:hypothetical protein